MSPVCILKHFMSVFINACCLLSALPSLLQFGRWRLSLVAISFYVLSLLFGPCCLSKFTLAGLLWASVWSKNKGRAEPLGPSPGCATAKVLPGHSIPLLLLAFTQQLDILATALITCTLCAHLYRCSVDYSLFVLK